MWAAVVCLWIQQWQTLKEIAKQLSDISVNSECGEEPVAAIHSRCCMILKIKIKVIIDVSI